MEETRLAKPIEDYIDNSELLQERGKQLATVLHELVLKGGQPARQVADLLHGTWLGHPLHPLLTDIVLGAWSIGALFDVISVLTRSSEAAKAADSLLTIGTIAAVPTSITGLTDFSTIPKPAASAGLAHAIAMDICLGAYLLSLRARSKGKRGQGLAWSALGMGVMTVGAYLGGHLVFGKRVGVNRLSDTDKAQSWTAVLADGQLPEHEPKEVDVEGQPVLLYRHNGDIFAVSATCPHAEGPLAKGEFNHHHVRCPWHDSVFNLADGGVVHGPSTYPLALYETRVRQGQIEIKEIKR